MGGLEVLWRYCCAVYGKPVDVFIGDINEAARFKAVDWITTAGTSDGQLESFDMSGDWQTV